MAGYSRAPVPPVYLFTPQSTYMVKGGTSRRKLSWFTTFSRFIIFFYGLWPSQRISGGSKNDEKSTRMGRWASLSMGQTTFMAHLKGLF